VPEFALEAMRSELDDLNVTYVATTRPEERLYILMQAGAKVADKSDTFQSKLEAAFVELLGNESSISFGVPENARQTFRPSSGPMVNYESLDTTQGRPEIRYKNVDAEKDDSADARSYGEFVHHALSLVRNASMLDVTIQMLLHKHPDAGVHWVSDVQRTVKNPDLARWFDQDAEIISEQDIVNARGQWLRPDRVVLDNNAIYVLDFKTGIPKPEHKDQVQEYAALLSEILSLPSQAYLYYTREGELRQVI
jgi:ATP-dependent exoDNAse (exonuclease V) beta subunit